MTGTRAHEAMPITLPQNKTVFGKFEKAIEHRCTLDPSEIDLQDHLLQGVSRTFALTIPVLPKPLNHVVANAYLLCRIVDTIEDEQEISAEDKSGFCKRFIQAVEGKADTTALASDLSARLSGATLPAEHELIERIPEVLAITEKFNPVQRTALIRCVTIMSEGMAWFQLNTSADGLADQEALDQYCYYVAGIVGEMLTELFCDYCQPLRIHHDRMMRLGVAFGQGLQMTNILLDIWDDYPRGACWLPRDVFEAEGYNLDNLGENHHQPAFRKGMGRLIGIAHGHLRCAMEYTLLIPTQERGMRNFCLWALAMAMLSLRRINQHRDYDSRNEVKISRRAVYLTVLNSKVWAGNDEVLMDFFELLGKRLPYTKSTVRAPEVKVSVSA